MNNELNIEELRKQFPALHQKVYNTDLVYFDNAATTQKPGLVIDILNNYYSKLNSNIHRGVHFLSQQATEAFELARTNVKDFINAGHSHEIIFTRGTTESINLVASSFCRKFLNKGDEVLITTMEHHSNIVPWQIACETHGAKLVVMPITDEGTIEPGSWERLLSPKTKILAVTHVSNTLGSVNPVKEIIEAAHANGTPVLLDGAQAVAHTRVDVQQLDCDFYCFSGHKLYAPMGVGVLYGKEKWLNEMPPYQGGGEMIKDVSFERTIYNELPFKFEAGTPNVGDVIGLDHAIRFLNEIGFAAIYRYERRLLEYATLSLKTIPELRIIGNAPEKTAVISFLIGDIHPYDAGTILDKLGIAVRTGHHCTQPIMDRYGIHGTLRASFAIYNTTEEIDKLVEAINKVREIFE